jgi:hypothetical protein
MDVETKIQAENIRIMMADLGSIVDDTMVTKEARRNPRARPMICSIIVKHHSLFLDNICYSDRVVLLLNSIL